MSVFPKTDIEKAKTIMLLAGLICTGFVTSASIYATYSDLPKKVESTIKDLQELREQFKIAIEAINKDRTADREVLIRIDERLKRLTYQENGRRN